MDPNVRKVIELIAAALPAHSQNREDEFEEVELFEGDFKSQGMSFALGVAILKHKICDRYLVVNVKDIYSADSKNENSSDEDYFGPPGVSFMAHPAICDWLVESTELKKSKTEISFKDCVLAINGKTIVFGSSDAKEYGCYVLEHIFSHDLHEASFYSDIHTETLGEQEKTSGKRYYDACGVIEKRVAKEIGITDFLLFNSGERGFVRISPKYLP